MKEARARPSMTKANSFSVAENGLSHICPHIYSFVLIFLSLFVASFVLVYCKFLFLYFLFQLARKGCKLCFVALKIIVCTITCGGEAPLALLDPHRTQDSSETQENARWKECFSAL